MRGGQDGEQDRGTTKRCLIAFLTLHTYSCRLSLSRHRYRAEASSGSRIANLPPNSRAPHPCLATGTMLLLLLPGTVVVVDTEAAAAAEREKRSDMLAAGDERRPDTDVVLAAVPADETAGAASGEQVLIKDGDDEGRGRNRAADEAAGP